MIDKLLSVAQAEVGYLEKASNANLDNKTANAGRNNYTKYGAWYGLNGPSAYWCRMFISWVADQAGISTNVIPMMAYCPYCVTWYKTRGLFHTPTGYTPLPGDIIYYKDSSGVAVHVGIVQRYAGGKVYTIEGNTSGSAGVEPNGGGVFNKSYSLGNSRILGYSSPAYVMEQPDENGCPYIMPDSVLTTGNGGSRVMWVQWYLNALGYSIGTAGIDGQYGADTVKAVKAFQTDGGLTADGEAGPATIAALKRAVSTDEEALTMSQYTELKEALEAIGRDISQIKGLVEQQYKTIDQVPDWGREAVTAMLEKGIIDGVAEGNLGLSYMDVRHIVIDYRLSQQ